MFSTGQAVPQDHRSIYSSKLQIVPLWTLLSDWFYQLVENEEVIGTLIESNERIIAALESYDKVGLHEVSHLRTTHPH